MTTKATTKSQDTAKDIVALLRARRPLLWIVTGEEARVEGFLFNAAAQARYVPRTWDVGKDVCDAAGRVIQDLRDPDDVGALDRIEARSKGEGTGRNTPSDRGVWILRDLPPWLDGTIGIRTLRKLRNLARDLPMVPADTAQAIIVITPVADIPREIQGHATVIEWPMPDRAEVASILDAAINALPEDLQKDAAPNGTRESAIEAAVGLSGEEAQACYARSLVQHRRIDVPTVHSEKKRVVAKDGLLQWFDPLPNGLDAVGGLDLLKGWLLGRKLAYSPAARAYGLPAPKGAFLAGISGCGKSLAAKAIATEWDVPLIKLDLNALKSKFVGESEANLRRALRTLEALGRCVVWIDEVEKALQGATGGGSSDGGVSADVLGTILTWMQERTTEAFVIATANDIQGLPPELLRKGRFDELWFVDLPNRVERIEVLAASLRAYNRTADVVIGNQGRALVAATDGFTGSEIAELVPTALFSAFADGQREPTADDLLEAASLVVPLSKTMATKIDELRSWANGRARRATSDDNAASVKDSAPRAPVLDLAAE